jgi:hypothetical protein
MTRKEFINLLISRPFEPVAVVSCADWREAGKWKYSR